MAVMRGQMVNLREALRKRKSPLQLVQMPNGESEGVILFSTFAR